MSNSIDVHPVTSQAQMKTVIGLPYDLYAGEPAWRAPLRLERNMHFDPKKNPTLNGIEFQFFLAFKNNTPVGRIAAFINTPHQEVHKDGAGHFGFFDSVNDEEVQAALLHAAQNWLQEKGALKMVGPTNWTVNEEVGQLIDGFEHPPVIFMPYGRPDVPKALEAFGFEKATDLIAFQSDLHAGYPRPRQTQMMVKLAERDPSISWRRVTLSKFKDEVAMAMGIFNDAWSDNWGFVPFSDDQIDHMAGDMKPLIDEDLFLIGEVDGEAVAFLIMVPDILSAAEGLNGRLLPFGWAKFLYRLKVKGVKQARIPLMGLRKEWHNTRKGVAIVAQLCETAFAHARDKGYTHCELSWVLEDNKSMIRIAEQASAKPYKTYRMYEKDIA